jgi:hypothetical protein
MVRVVVVVMALPDDYKKWQCWLAPPLSSPVANLRKLLCCLLRRRRLGDSREHPDFPCSALANINCGPNASSLNWCTALVFAGELVFANGDGRVISQRQNLTNCYVVVIEPRLENTFISLCNICCRSHLIDLYAASCVQRGDPRGVLLIETFRIC